MIKTEVYILGYPIPISYQIHDPAYVEWKIECTTKSWETEHDLLNVLLRMHFCEYIEAAIREHAFMEQYAASQGHATDDWNDAASYYNAGFLPGYDTEPPF